jgi:hypothetical protein
MIPESIRTQMRRGFVKSGNAKAKAHLSRKKKRDKCLAESAHLPGFRVGLTALRPLKCRLPQEAATGLQSQSQETCRSWNIWA